MSEAINIDKVRSVLIGVAWHDVSSQTFSVGMQHFEADGEPCTEPTYGFSFRSSDTGETIYGRLNSIIALVVDE